MFKNIVKFSEDYISVINKSRAGVASAALSYTLTMTFFPLIICLYTLLGSLLGSSYEPIMRVLDFAENIMAAETVETLREFLDYVAANNSTAMMAAGVMLFITSASAAIRTIQITIGDMQGAQRFEGLNIFPISLLFSLVFVAATYAAVVLMLLSRQVINFLNRTLPFLDIAENWLYLRFVVLFGMLYLVAWCVYRVSMRRDSRYLAWPGAILGAVAMSAVSFVFSIFIGASTRYPLVYGSLASVILLMFWLYSLSYALYCGAALNVAIRDYKTEMKQKKPDEVTKESKKEEHKDSKNPPDQK